VPNGLPFSHVYKIFEKSKNDKKIKSPSDMNIADMKSLQNVSLNSELYRSTPTERNGKNSKLTSPALCTGGKKNVAVAVRSSATAEDLPGASFAGQQDTFLNVTQKNLLSSIKKCWSSLFTPRSIVYRKEKGFSLDQVLISVAIQELIYSKASGVMFTLEPVSGYR
jgi:pyruvate,water dikinase